MEVPYFVVVVVAAIDRMHVALKVNPVGLRKKGIIPHRKLRLFSSECTCMHETDVRIRMFPKKIKPV